MLAYTCKLQEKHWGILNLFEQGMEISSKMSKEEGNFHWRE
jgi:hypothetical protein